MKNWLVLIAVFGLVISVTVGAQEKGLIGYWNFDEGKGEVAKDSSGFKNDGVITGAKWVKGIKGSALEFNGQDNYVGIEVGEILQSTKAISIEAWIYPTPPHQQGYGGIVNNINGASNDNGRLLVKDDGGIIAQLHTWQQTFAGPTLGSNAWSHVVYVYDGKEETWYLNGKKEASSPYDQELNAGQNSITIGWGYNDPEYYHFKGIIDEVKIYSRALSEKEIADRYKEVKK